MIRRSLVVPLALAATVGLAGCSTFSDSDAAVRVGDEELSNEALGTIVRAADATAPEDGPFEASGDTTRSVAEAWLVTRVVEADVAANGGQVTEQDRADARAAREGTAGWTETPAPVQDLVVEQDAALTVWSGITESPSEEELRAAYDRGIERSGIACTAHILVETRAEALDVLDELDGGADFATLAQERSTDAGTAADGGVIPCSSTGEFRQNLIPEFVEAALDADIGEPTDPVRSDVGYHVILVRPFDDVGAEQLTQVWNDPLARFNRAVDAQDVYVDPRIGVLGTTATLTPLG